jgi:hypothetical protein
LAAISLERPDDSPSPSIDGDGSNLPESPRIDSFRSFASASNIGIIPVATAARWLLTISLNPPQVESAGDHPAIHNLKGSKR